MPPRCRRDAAEMPPRRDAIETGRDRSRSVEIGRGRPGVGAEEGWRWESAACVSPSQANTHRLVFPSSAGDTRERVRRPHCCLR